MDSERPTESIGTSGLLRFYGITGENISGNRMDSAEILVEVLGEERRERRHQAAERQQALVQNGQRDERLLRVSAHTLAATTVQTHVAVREQVDEVHEARHHRVQTIRLHFLADEADQLLRGGLSVIQFDENARAASDPSRWCWTAPSPAKDGTLCRSWSPST